MHKTSRTHIIMLAKRTQVTQHLLTKDMSHIWGSMIELSSSGPQASHGVELHASRPGLASTSGPLISDTKLEVLYTSHTTPRGLNLEPT